MWDTASKVAAAAAVVERSIFLNSVKPRIRPEIIAEHRVNPFGRHSVDLEMVLRYLRRVQAGPRFVIVSEPPYQRYCIAEYSGVRGAPITVTDECFESEEEAQHAVFIRRLNALGDPDVDAVLEQAR